MKKVIGFIILITVINFLTVITVFARVTPEDIVNAKKEAYLEKVKDYSPLNQQKLQNLQRQIAQINEKRSGELDQIMKVQAAILDEYQKRRGDESNENIERARYWITYAHEAVAYQAAKIYVFSLTSENNIKGDVLSTISLFQSELNSTRSKVIDSQNILKQVVND